MITVVKKQDDYNSTEYLEYLITSESELNSLPGNPAPGSVAYTAGFKKIWHLGNDGTWVSVI